VIITMQDADAAARLPLDEAFLCAEPAPEPFFDASDRHFSSHQAVEEPTAALKDVLDTEHTGECGCPAPTHDIAVEDPKLLQEISASKMMSMQPDLLPVAGLLAGEAEGASRSPPRLTKQDWHLRQCGTVSAGEGREGLPRSVTSVNRQKWYDFAFGTVSVPEGRERAEPTTHGHWEAGPEHVACSRAGMKGQRPLHSKWEASDLGTVLTPHLIERPEPALPHGRWPATPALMARSSPGLPDAIATPPPPPPGRAGADAQTARARGRSRSRSSPPSVGGRTDKVTRV